MIHRYFILHIFINLLQSGRNMQQFYKQIYCFCSKVEGVVFCIILKIYEIQRKVFREKFTKVFGQGATLNNMRNNLGISEVRKLYLHIDEVFGKAATNNEKLCVMNLAFLLIFLIFFQSNPPPRIQLPVVAENLSLKGNCLKDGNPSVSLPSLKEFFFDLKNLLYCIKQYSYWYQLSKSFRDKLQFSLTCLNSSGLFVTLSI